MERLLLPPVGAGVPDRAAATGAGRESPALSWNEVGRDCNVRPRREGFVGGGAR